MRIALLLPFACLLTSCLQKVTTDEQWGFKELRRVDPETGMREMSMTDAFMPGRSTTGRGTQDDVDRFASRKFDANTNLDSKNLDFANVDEGKFRGSKKNVSSAGDRYDTNSLEPETWRGNKSFAGDVDYKASSSSLAAKNWSPRGDEYYHVSDLKPRDASRRVAADDYVTASRNASNDVLLGRDNETITRDELRSQREENPDAREKIRTPGVSLEEVKEMLER